MNRAARQTPARPPFSRPVRCRVYCGLSREPWPVGGGRRRSFAGTSWSAPASHRPARPTRPATAAIERRSVIRPPTWPPARTSRWPPSRPVDARSGAPAQLRHQRQAAGLRRRDGAGDHGDRTQPLDRSGLRRRTEPVPGGTFVKDGYGNVNKLIRQVPQERGDMHDVRVALRRMGGRGHDHQGARRSAAAGDRAGRAARRRTPPDGQAVPRPAQRWNRDQRRAGGRPGHPGVLTAPAHRSASDGAARVARRGSVNR